MDLYGMDETTEEQPELELSGTALKLTKLTSAEVGQKFTLTAVATVCAVSAENGPDGLPNPCVCFDLSRIQLQAEPMSDTQKIGALYPSTPGPKPMAMS